MSTVKACLSSKPQRIIQVTSSDTVQRALELMKSDRVRAILVIDNNQLKGIVSQGDCAIRAFLAGRDAKTTPVSDIMTANPMTVKPGDPMELCMGVMATRGIRHLPVVAQNQVVGVVSIGDVVKCQIAEHAREAESLKTYIAAG